MRRGWVLTAGSVLSIIVGTVSPGASAGVYLADEEVTYKEYWVPRSEYTGGCPASAPGAEGIFPGLNCQKTLRLSLPDDVSGALRAELYLDLWQNGDQARRANVRINGGAPVVPDVGAAWSRTPYIAAIPLGDLGQENTLTFGTQGSEAYGVLDVAIRIYHDAANPLVAGPSSDVEPPTGGLRSVGGEEQVALGGDLLVDGNLLTLSADAQGAAYVEFHAFYYGFDDDADGELVQWHNRKRPDLAPGPNATIGHVGTATAAPYTVTWDVSNVPSQDGVFFKVRLVDSAGNVREAPGGRSGEFRLLRSNQLVESYPVQAFRDLRLSPGTAGTVTIDLPDSVASQVTGARLLGAYRGNPSISVNGAAAVPGLPNGSGFGRFVVEIPPAQLRPGTNEITLGASSGEVFIEQPGPVLVLTRAPGGAPLPLHGFKQAFVTDNFTSGVLAASLWSIIDPQQNATVTVAGEAVSITVPANGLDQQPDSPVNSAPRIIQPASDLDFDLEARFDSPLNAGQQQGLLFQEDVNDYLRVALHSPPDGSGTRLVAHGFRNGVEQGQMLVQPIALDVPLQLKVRREVDRWSVSYAPSAESEPVWVATPDFEFPFKLRHVGAFAASTGATPPGHTAVLDRFLNAMSPEDIDLSDTTPPQISDVAAQPSDRTVTITWLTDEPANSRIRYGVGGLAGGELMNAALRVQHSVTLTGLEPETTYQFAIDVSDAAGNTTTTQDVTFITGAQDLPGSGGGGGGSGGGGGGCTAGPTGKTVDPTLILLALSALLALGLRRRGT